MHISSNNPRIKKKKKKEKKDSVVLDLQLAAKTSCDIDSPRRQGSQNKKPIYSINHHSSTPPPCEIEIEIDVEIMFLNRGGGGIQSKKKNQINQPISLCLSL